MKAESIPNFPRYLITKGGDVWSEKTNRWLKPSAKKNGYLYVTIYDANKKRHSKSIHSLVAETYLGPRAEGWVVNHKSGVKLDNDLNNLEYITVSQNNAHAYSMGLSSKRGSKASGSKLTEKQVSEIKKLLTEEELSHGQIAKKFQVCRTTITMISTNKTWRHVK
ncbi:MAG: hypothetical protein DCF15_11230 [Phormidesmis priestleyi]|uniref:HNH nuclease domain-containing protein n=1 Tax=Phormidesmis priestleyi TaxID=268141 RepID=A0A2W4Z9C4_9CYAN|nr:MAG: hypothetical protein DCF15_11230 [Phormidesmis priestleyi]